MFETGRLDELRRHLEAHVAEGDPPGLVAGVSRGGETHLFAAGVPRDTIFRIASMTKPITAVAAMMLVEEGTLRLSDPIEGLAPELAGRRVLRRMDAPLDDHLPARRPITLEDVLSFRLGWGLDFNREAPFVKAANDLPGFGMPNPGWPGDDDAFLRELGRLPLQAQPGERWLYTLGSNVLGVLIARAAGQPLDVVLEERLFSPLGMSDTGFFVPAAKLERLITGYVKDKGSLIPFEPLNGLYARRPSFLAGDSGLVSTLEDYLAFARFMVSGTTRSGRRLLEAETIEAMTSNRLTPEQMTQGELILGPGGGWGLGLGVQVSAHGLEPGAFGWNGGFGTSWFNDPARDLTAILLTQRVFDGPDPPTVHKSFRRDAYAAAGP